MLWRYYFPDLGETEEDARWFPGLKQPSNRNEAAQLACELDYTRHDGWERGENPFEIAIVCPDGVTATFRARHEPSVNHVVSES